MQEDEHVQRALRLHPREQKVAEWRLQHLEWLLPVRYAFVLCSISLLISLVLQECSSDIAGARYQR
jgi:hypothetical protein